jgi:hypothetical protein
MLTVPGNGEQDTPAPTRFRVPEVDGSRDVQENGLLNATVRASREIPPEQAGRVLRMQVKTGFDRDIIARNLDDVEREAAAADFNPELFRRNSPKMAKWLSESPYHVSVAREDLKALGNLEAMFYRKDDPTRPQSDKEVEAASRKVAKRRAEKQKLGGVLSLEAIMAAHTGDTSKDHGEEGYFREEYAKRQRAEKYISGEGPTGPLEAISKRHDDNPLFYLPFIGSIHDSGNALILYQAAKAKVAGTADEEQEDLILQAARLNAAAERRGSGIIGGAAEIMAGIPAVAGEFAMTGPTYRSAKVGVEAILHNALKAAVTGSTRGALAKTAGVLAGAGAQTLAMGAGGVGEAAGRMTPALQSATDKSGELRAVLDPSTADDLGPAIMKTLGSRFVETLSERAGVGMERLGGAMKKAVASRFLAKFPDEGADGLLRKIKDASGWHGVVGEVFEERVSEAGRALIGVEDYKPPTSEQLISEIIAFAVPGAAASVARTATKALTPIEKAKTQQEATIPTNDILEAVVKTVQESGLLERAPEAAEKAIEVAAVDSPSEYAYADARTFNQIMAEKPAAEGGKIDPKALAERLGVTQKEYDLAIETGGDLKFKTSRAAVELVSGGHEEFFKEHLRFDPGDMSRAETELEVKRAVNEAKAEEKAEQDVEAAKERAALSKQYAEGAKRIGDSIESAVRQAGRKANEAKTFRKLVESAFRVMGERYGLDPEQQFSQYELEVRGPEQIEAAGQTEGKVFNQPDTGDFKGHLRIGKNLKVALDLTRKADPSTPPHEFFGHFWLHMMGDIIESGKAPDTMKADFQAILDYIGAKDRASITDEQHEKFARTIEKYLMEGHAPSKALRGAFFRFLEWLTEIYKEIKESYFMGVDLSPKIKAVLDRLLATDAEIQAAQKDEGRGALFSDFAEAKKAGASASEAERHMKRQAELRAAATSRILSRTMGDIKNENEEWWEEGLEKIRATVATELDAQKVYKTLAVFKEGKLPDGTKIRLDPKAVASVMGSDLHVTPVLPKFITTGKGGIHPDIAADLLQYPSGAEMLDAISRAEPREEAIERIAEERMRAEYGEPPTQAELAEEAKKAIHGDEYGALIEDEMRIIAKGAQEGRADTASILFNRLPRRDVLKARAQEQVANSAYRSIDPRMYETAERRAALRAVKEWKAGNRAGALKAKAEQLTNAELYSAAIEAKEYVADKLVDFRKLYRKDEKLSKTRDTDLINAARAILARMNIGKSDKSASSYMESIKKYDPDMYEAILPMILEAGDGQREWKDLAYGELRKTFEAVDAIWENSLRSRQFEVLGKKMDLDEVTEELRQATAEKLPAGAKGLSHAVTTWDKLKSGLLGIKASLRRMESWVDMMDGGNPNGPFRKYLFTPVSEGADKARKMRRDLERELASIFKALEKDFTAEKIDAPELGYRFGDGGSGFAELFGALLHTGNASNKMKLIVGNKWGTVDEDGILDDSSWEAFRQRMIREGKIRQEHYEAAQKIWDLFEREKAGAWKAHRDMYGFYPSEITAETITTPWGDFRGGYVPAKADSEKTNDAERREEREAIEGNDNSFAFPSTGLGATLKRSSTYAKPLVLDVRLLRSHINWLSRFVHIQPRVRDVARLMLKHDFRDTLDKFDPAVGNDLVAPYLQRAATQVVETPMKGKGGRALATVAREVRKRTGMLLMAGNLTNALQNFTGLYLASLKVKPQYLRSSLVKFMKDPKGVAKANREASVFMENRTDTETQAIVGDMEAMLVNASPTEKVKDFLDRNGMILQRVTQNILDNVAWDAAKDQAIAEGATQEEAIRQANSAVRQTQGSGAPEDISRAETGNAVVRILNQFWGYFNMQANLLGTEFAKTADGVGLKRGAGRALYIYLMGFMAPAVIAESIVALSKGTLDEDDDEEYLDDVLALFFGSQARTAAALLPGGAVARSAWGAFTKDNRYDDRIQTSPAISILESAVKAPASIYRAIIDEGKTSTAVKDAMTLLGLLSGLPLPAAGRPISYLSDVVEGVAEPSDPIDFTRGLLTGKPGQRR